MHVLSYWQDLAPLLYALIYSLWLFLLGCGVKCYITPLVLHQEHKNYCSFKKMWKWLLCFSWIESTNTRLPCPGEFWVPPRMEIPQPPCTPVPVLYHTHEDLFSWCQSQNFLFQIVSIAFHPSNVHLSKGSGSVFSKLSLAHNSCTANRKEKQNIDLACPHGTHHLAGSQKLAVHWHRNIVRYVET